MKPAERGAYILLLCRAWQGTPPATLPNDDADLASLSGMPSLADWLSVKPAVLRCFTLRNERLLNVRLEQEYLRFEEKSAKASKAGRASGVSRQHQPLTTEQTFNVRSADVEHRGSGSGSGVGSKESEGMIISRPPPRRDLHDADAEELPACDPKAVAAVLKYGMERFRMAPLDTTRERCRANIGELLSRGYKPGQIEDVIAWAVHPEAGKGAPLSFVTATDPARFVQWLTTSERNHHEREETKRRQRR